MMEVFSCHIHWPLVQFNLILNCSAWWNVLYFSSVESRHNKWIFNGWEFNSCGSRGQRGKKTQCTNDALHADFRPELFHVRYKNEILGGGRGDRGGERWVAVMLPVKQHTNHWETKAVLQLEQRYNQNDMPCNFWSHRILPRLCKIFPDMQTNFYWITLSSCNRFPPLKGKVNSMQTSFKRRFDFDFHHTPTALAKP